MPTLPSRIEFLDPMSFTSGQSASTVPIYAHDWTPYFPAPYQGTAADISSGTWSAFNGRADENNFFFKTGSGNHITSMHEYDSQNQSVSAYPKPDLHGLLLRLNKRWGNDWWGEYDASNNAWRVYGYRISLKVEHFEGSGTPYQSSFICVGTTPYKFATANGALHSNLLYGVRDEGFLLQADGSTMRTFEANGNIWQARDTGVYSQSRLDAHTIWLEVIYNPFSTFGDRSFRTGFISTGGSETVVIGGTANALSSWKNLRFSELNVGCVGFGVGNHDVTMNFAGSHTLTNYVECQNFKIERISQIIDNFGTRSTATIYDDDFSRSGENHIKYDTSPSTIYTPKLFTFGAPNGGSQGNVSGGSGGSAYGTTLNYESPHDTSGAVDIAPMTTNTDYRNDGTQDESKGWVFGGITNSAINTEYEYLDLYQVAPSNADQSCATMWWTEDLETSQKAKIASICRGSRNATLAVPTASGSTLSGYVGWIKRNNQKNGTYTRGISRYVNGTETVLISETYTTGDLLWLNFIGIRLNVDTNDSSGNVDLTLEISTLKHLEESSVNYNFPAMNYENYGIVLSVTDSSGSKITSTGLSGFLTSWNSGNASETIPRSHTLLQLDNGAPPTLNADNSLGITEPTSAGQLTIEPSFSVEDSPTYEEIDSMAIDGSEMSKRLAFQQSVAGTHFFHYRRKAKFKWKVNKADKDSLLKFLQYCQEQGKGFTLPYMNTSGSADTIWVMDKADIKIKQIHRNFFEVGPIRCTQSLQTTGGVREP